LWRTLNTDVCETSKRADDHESRAKFENIGVFGELKEKQREETAESQGVTWASHDKWGEKDWTFGDQHNYQSSKKVNLAKGEGVKEKNRKDAV